MVATIPPVLEPEWSLEVIFVVAYDCDVLYKDVAVAEDYSDDVGDEAAPEESHHDGVYEREVPRCIGSGLLLTLKPNMSVISSCG